MSEVNKVVKKDFETLVGILGNPVRRSIIKKLSQGPDYTLRLSNELNIAQQLAAKHLKIIQDAELVNVIREKSRFGADKNVFQINKFYSLQIDFSPNLYNERLISFNNPNHWIQQDNYMNQLEEQVINLDNDKINVDDISELKQVIQIIDEELESLEKRRARLLYIRNLALGATQEALEDVDYKKKQIIHYLVDQGPISIQLLSKTLDISEELVKDTIIKLESDGVVKIEGDIVFLEV
ncbi:ArsR family transcriptional regulator [Candidatus Bathyarchaeota archaeon]|nr:ArsR family transcriptional regulator [Candidatus Bathyarchaeota archaeon]